MCAYMQVHGLLTYAPDAYEDNAGLRGPWVRVVGFDR
jgi:hypothetical protein